MFTTVQILRVTHVFKKNERNHEFFVEKGLTAIEIYEQMLSMLVDAVPLKTMFVGTQTMRQFKMRQPAWIKFFHTMLLSLRMTQPLM